MLQIDAGLDAYPSLILVPPFQKSDEWKNKITEYLLKLVEIHHCPPIKARMSLPKLHEKIEG